MIMNETRKNPPSAEHVARWTFWLTLSACLTFTLVVAVFVL
jgi:hypothetical protein